MILTLSTRWSQVSFWRKEKVREVAFEDHLLHLETNHWWMNLHRLQLRIRGWGKLLQIKDLHLRVRSRQKTFRLKWGTFLQVLSAMLWTSRWKLLRLEIRREDQKMKERETRLWIYRGLKVQMEIHLICTSKEGCWAKESEIRWWDLEHKLKLLKALVRKTKI